MSDETSARAAATMIQAAGHVNGDIHKSIVAIIEALPAIGKDQQMSGGGGGSYRYRGIEDILPHVGAAFRSTGVHCSPRYRQISDSTYQVRSGAEWRRVVLEGTFRFYAGDGSWVETVAFGEANDNGDKAHAKAQTAAFKAALVQTFVLAEQHADDPDHTSSEASEAATPPDPNEGLVTVANAKAAFMAACEGDKDCARTEWEAAALEVVNEHFVNPEALDAALEKIQAAEATEPTPEPTE